MAFGLRGFRRVRLAPGECRTVTFEVSTEQLSHLDADYRRVVEPGRIRVHVGRSVADLPWTAEVRLVGPTADVRTRDQFVTRTRID